MFAYKTCGVCSTEINVEIKNDIIKHVEFVRGCPGNLFGISAFLIGMNIDEAIANLQELNVGLKEHLAQINYQKHYLNIKTITK